MNLSFSPQEVASDVPTQAYPFSPPEISVSDMMTIQVYQDNSMIFLARGPKASYSSARLLGVNLDEEGTTSVRSPLNVFICEDETGVHAENEELSIFGCGETVSEAIDDFITALFETWQGLKDVPESDLTADAVELRKRLMIYIKVA